MQPPTHMSRPDMDRPDLPAPSVATAFRAGVAAIGPVLLGVVPFGLIAGVAVTDIRLGLGEAVGFSLIAFAGAAQLVAVELLGAGAPLAVVVGTALIVNLRFLMYSASLAPYLAAEPLHRRAIGAYLLTDQAYAVAIARFSSQPEFRQRWPYYLGAALAMWTTWQVSTFTGAVLGDVIPASVPLGFAVPLTFIALLIPAITDRPTLAAAATAALVATAASPLPANLGMLTGALAGIAVGATLALTKAARTGRRPV
jgi:predicted branched-subunit amino acid permease